ncbi:MAG TPA: peptidoglycan DD-metalloendopeptidase family protein [Burkholderiales bacterium]|nr:peptidoglycan DD-metalloendopeptidase family protein [Burkholderiales bacterium]
MRFPAARLALAALAATGSVAAQAPREDDLRELRARIDRLKQELAAAEGARTEAADELRGSETAISEANRRLAELTLERGRVRADSAKIAAESAALRADLERRQGTLAGMLYARYTLGERSLPRTLLSGDDPHAIARQLVYERYLARAQGDLIGRARDDLARLAALEAGAREQAAALASVEARSRAERDTLRAKAAERKQVLARVGEQVRKGRADLANAQKNEARLARLVEELARAVRPPPRPGAARPEAGAGAPAIGAFGGLKGRLRPPVQGELMARFGAQQQAASPSPKGIFLRAPAGTGVQAVAGGRVVFADWMRGYGNLLIVDHGDDYLSIYGNNEAVLKRVGDAVHAGEAVATVGTSGGNESAGLYFELRHQGRAFDPVPWLQSR